MVCDRCEKENEGRPWVFADIYSGDVHGYCEACAIVVIDEHIARKKELIQKARNN